MISIYVGKAAPDEENDLEEDDQYGVYACLSVPEFTTIFEANYAWFKALELDGYSIDIINKCKEALYSLEKDLLN